MRNRIGKVWIHLRSSFWFVPALMIAGAAALAVFLVERDANVGINLADRFPRIFGANAEGARSILSTVASSMISIAGVTFSITIVALSLASGQYTSRVLRNFMRDRANQTVLGVFLSIFIYCLIVLRTIRGGSETFVPSLSVVTGIVFGFIGIGFLIFFIHHVATSIQASTIICRISEETFNVIDHLYPKEQDTDDEDPEEVKRCVEKCDWHEIHALNTGYVQTVYMEGLAEWAEKNDSTVHMLRGIGEFVVAGKPLLALAKKPDDENELTEELNDFYSISSYRTIEQDAAFGIRQLVDIALKALSPGVNDTTTAVTCLHYLGAILAKLGRRTIPGEITRKDGKVRLIARRHTYAYFADESFHQIRQDAKDNVATHIAMLETLKSASRPALSRGRREVLIHHLERISGVVEKNVKDEGDLETLRERCDELKLFLRGGGAKS